MARDITLLDAHSIVRAGILAELALIVTAGQVWGRESGSSKSEDGGSELHFGLGECRIWS